MRGTVDMCNACRAPYILLNLQLCLVAVNYSLQWKSDAEINKQFQLFVKKTLPLKLGLRENYIIVL